MHNFPARIELVEVGPRDGFQAEAQIIPTQDKIKFIQALIGAGLKKIQVTSFVSQSKVPQLADAEEILAALPRTKETCFSALTLNAQGVRRALQSGADQVEVSLSASLEHGLRNTGMSLEKARSEALEMVKLCQKNNTPVRASIQCAFGCVYEGFIPEQRVLDLALDLAQAGVETLVLADTTGLGSPVSIVSLLCRLQRLAPDISIGLHLHDTRGLGLVNMFCALEYGVRSFDTSIGGMGGCPFVTNASGNISSEDAAYLCQRLGVETGIELQGLLDLTQKLEGYLGHGLPARIKPHTWQTHLC